MRYVHRPAREQAEAEYLPGWHGVTFEPHGHLNIADGVPLSTTGTELVDVGGTAAAIHADSASWAFLSSAEADVFRSIDGAPFGALGSRLGHDVALDFVSHLYRRGLLDIAGRRAVDGRMFAFGPNYDEGHLVELLVTEKCNLACPYCLAGAGPSMPSMDEDLVRRTIDMAFAMDDCSVLAFEFAGGEPFLKFDLMRYGVNLIRSHPGNAGRTVFISIQTNATLLDAERVRWIVDNDVRVGISIDGGAFAQNVSRPTRRGGGSFDALMHGIDLLQEHDVPFGGLVVLNRSNIADAESLARFMLERSIHGFRINPIAYLGDARHNWDEVGLEQSEIVAFFQEFLGLVVDERLPILEDNLRSMCDFLTSKQRRTRCMRSACGAGDTFQSITANGDIFPCGRSTQSPGLRLGNVRDPRYRELSAPAVDHPRIVEIRSRRPNDFDDCARCHYRELCQAGCSVQAWEAYGTVRHKTPECEFYKTMYPWLMDTICHRPGAFEHLESMTYFGGEGQFFDPELVPTPVG